MLRPTRLKRRGTVGFTSRILLFTIVTVGVAACGKAAGESPQRTLLEIMEITPVGMSYSLYNVEGQAVFYNDAGIDTTAGLPEDLLLLPTGGNPGLLPPWIFWSSFEHELLIRVFRADNPARFDAACSLVFDAQGLVDAIVVEGSHNRARDRQGRGQQGGENSLTAHFRAPLKSR